MILLGRSKEHYCNACRVKDGVPTFTIIIAPSTRANRQGANLCKHCLEDLIKKAQDALNSEE
jgi:hypothetical protein